jgi:hypothetical protein
MMDLAPLHSFIFFSSLQLSQQHCHIVNLLESKLVPDVSKSTRLNMHQKSQFTMQIIQLILKNELRFFG